MSGNFPQAGNVMFAFSTPLLVRRWPESDALNRDLRNLILEKEKAAPGMSRSNVGGWHSDEDFFHWSHPAVAELLKRVMEGTQEITKQVSGDQIKGRQADVAVAGWANVSRDRNYNSIHNHLGYTWSGVYYVTLGNNDPAVPNSGRIEFLDPRLGIEWGGLPGTGRHLRLQPEPGMMLMFPYWLLHWVHPFHGSGERISIAFNVKLSFPEA